MAASQIDWAEDLVTEVVGERLKAATRKRGAEPLSHAIEAKCNACQPEGPCNPKCAVFMALKCLHKPSPDWKLLLAAVSWPFLGQKNAAFRIRGKCDDLCGLSQELVGILRLKINLERNAIRLAGKIVT